MKTALVILPTPTSTTVTTTATTSLAEKTTIKSFTDKKSCAKQ